MGIVQKLKNLHKQTMLTLNSIKRVVVSDEAGVNNAKYLNRVKPLSDYLSNKETKSSVQGTQQLNSINDTSATSASSRTTIRRTKSTNTSSKI